MTVTAARRRDIQGLRALAVLLVVAYHAGLGVQGGFVGVDVFFVISGFVITATLSSELVEKGRIDLPAFYGRRVRRLLPALAVMVAVVALVGTVAGPIATQQTGARTGIFASLFAANAYLYDAVAVYFAPAATLNPLLHTWTLAVEEQFYVVFPALLLAAWWLGRRRSVASARASGILVVLAVSAVSFWLSVRLSQGTDIHGIGWPEQFAFYSSPTRAWEFGIGAVLALGAPTFRRLAAPLAESIGWAGLSAIGVAAFAIGGTSGYPGTVALLPVAGAAGLLVAGIPGRGPISRLLGLQPAVTIGDLSYSIYLWHWPMIVFANALLPGRGWVAPAAAGFSFLPAWASYRYVENPIRSGARFRGRRVLRLAAICVVLPVAACGGQILAQRAFAAFPLYASWEHSQGAHADVTSGCDSPIPLAERGAKCTWPVAGSRGAVVLIGDSNAGHFTEPFISAANSDGFDAVVAVYSACPFVDLTVAGLGPLAAAGECRTFDLDSLAALLRMRPSLVVIANRDDVYFENPIVRLGDQGLASATYDPIAKARLWSEGMASILRRLNAAGVPVILVRPIPELPTSERCAVVRFLVSECSPGVSRAAVDANLLPTVAVEDRALARARLSSSIDFRDAFCRDAVCKSTRDGVVLYRDEGHLGVAGSLTLTGRFRTAIAARARR